MTKEELYNYMLAYQQEHEFCEKEQSNFISLLNTLKTENKTLETEQKQLTKNKNDDRGETL